MVAGRTVHSSRAGASRRRGARARLLLGVHRLPTYRHLVLVVRSRAGHPVRVFRQSHLARLHRAARLASPRRARRGSQLVTAQGVAFLAGADGGSPLWRLARVQSLGGGLSSIPPHTHVSILAAVQRFQARTSGGAPPDGERVLWIDWSSQT